MDIPESEKPLETDTLAGDVSRGFDCDDALGARLDRYSIAKKRALVNLDILISDRGSDELTQTRRKKASVLLNSCGNYLSFRNYYTEGKTRLHKASFCKQHLICPLCAIRRGAKKLDAYLKRYEVITKENPSWRLSMITLTVKNGEDLQERYDHLRKSVRVLLDRRRDYLKKGRGRTEWRKVHGFVGTYEVTNKGKGWHPHAHVMVLHSSSFDYKELQREWKDVTGDSHVLNVTAAMHPDEPERDFLEVFKYAVKFSDLTPEQNIDAWEILRGKRLLFSGGAFRGVKVPEELTDEPLENLPYIELFYVHTQSGYSLKKTTHFDQSPEDVRTRCA